MRRKIRCRSSRSPSSTRCRSTARSATTSGTVSGSSPTAAPGKRLPGDLKTIVANAINDAGLKQRDDIKTFNATVQADLQSKGLAFTKPAPDSFRAKLRDAGFYGEWKSRFGDEAWGLLEGAVGKLA